MRVISPPRDYTPAILQAVRGSWPRGVVSEKKVGDSAYEFKLRGYRCTFPCLPFIYNQLLKCPILFDQGFKKILLQLIPYDTS